MLVLDEGAVTRGLDPDACREAVRTAMIALSRGETRQLPRAILPLAAGGLLGLMPGTLPAASARLPHGCFGAKLVSVFEDPDRPGRSAHRGVVVLFDGADGRPVCVAEAGAITQIRTAAATALATDALASPSAEVMAVLGHGHQALAHIEAIARVRRLRKVVIWGRAHDRAQAFAEATAARTGLAVTATAEASDAVGAADIICTVTAAQEPVLEAEWVRAGAHVNLVGSSVPTSLEADPRLVAWGRYFVESRETAQAAAAEFLAAKRARWVTDQDIAAEIGEVLSGDKPGRTSAAEITVYKSLGHPVQDLAACALLYASGRPSEPDGVARA